MLRISGVDIPEQKKLIFALCYIHGVGRRVAADVVKRANLDENKRARDLRRQIGRASCRERV